jgi:hypothetical protein
VGRQLGRPSGARFRTYERLKGYADEVKGTLFESQELLKAIDQIYRYPLRQAAVDALNRQLIRWLIWYNAEDLTRPKTSISRPIPVERKSLFVQNMVAQYTAFDRIG